MTCQLRFSLLILPPTQLSPGTALNCHFLLVQSRSTIY